MPKITNIFFSGRIATHAMEKLCETILTEINDEDTLNLLIHSGGGNASLAFGIAQFIEQLPCHVVTYNMGNTDSAAILLYAAGKQRFSSPFSRFLTHPLSIEAQEKPYTLTELQNLVSRLEQETKLLTKYLEQRTGTSAQQWQHLMETAVCLDAPGAIQLGLVHSVSAQPPSNAHQTIFIH